MSKIAQDITTYFNNKERREFATSWKRMDQDYARWNLDYIDDTGETAQYISQKTKEHPSEIRVVSNDMRTHSDSTQSILNAADMQIRVLMAETEGEDKREEIGKLERFFHFALEQFDVKLRKLTRPPLRPDIIWYSCLRGAAAARILVRKGDNNTIGFNGVGLDPRWLVYDIGENDFEIVSYKTFRTAASLKNKYDFKADKPDNNPVIDHWENLGKGKVKNTVVTGGEFLQAPKIYKMTSMPFVIVPVPISPQITTKDGISSPYGDSIFASGRDINAIRDRFASVVANHANLMAKQAMINYRAEGGNKLDSTTNIPGGVVELVMGKNKLEPSPMQEISPTVIQFLNWLNDELDQTLLPKIPINSPPPSGTLYNLAQEAGNKVFNPQLRTLENFYSDTCRLVEEQSIDGGLKINVKGEDEKKKYFETKVTPVDLKKPHMIKVSLTARTPWTQLDTAQVADMLRQSGVPEQWLWENIYKFPDPKGMRSLQAKEVYEHSPVGLMLEAVKALDEEGREDEKIQVEGMIERMRIQEEQDLAAGMPPPEGGVQ